MKDGLSGGVDETLKVDTLQVTDDVTITDTLTVSGATTLSGAATLSSTLGVSGASTFSAAVTVGVDDTGYDVKLFGATASSHLLWDESADQLDFVAAGCRVAIGKGITTATAGTYAGFIFAAALDAVSDTAACSVVNYYSTLTTTGAAVPTLADGTIVGQLKKIQMIVDAGDAVLTPTTLTGGSTITFADVGDVAELIWTGSSWQVLALYNVVDGATAPALA